jgi:hypothetical protein
MVYSKTGFSPIDFQYRKADFNVQKVFLQFDFWSDFIFIPQIRPKYSKHRL